MNANQFVIDPPVFDRAQGIARLSYRLDGLRFTETLAFAEGFEVTATQTAAFAKLLDLTAAVLGVSYFKLTAPTEIALPEFALTGDERDFVKDVYENGLGEFYARNNLKRFGKLHVAAREDNRGAPDAPALPARTLLPIGGGKDSLVSVSLLEAAGVDFTPFAVNPKGPILSSVARIGRPPVYVERTLDPEMIRLSGEPGHFNGHVPSTAINSMIASLAALLHGHDRIVLSNERSASEGNVEFDGRQANHQYSKSLDFEARIRRILADATAGALDYFSILRPYSEARIAALFARTERFDRDFSSCNRNFRLSGHDGPLWCGECPKCLFVFLIFAPVMDKARLLGIFGRDLLANRANVPAYRELTGLAGQKPWECVGEILEAAACLHRLTASSVWKDDAVVAELRADLLAKYGEVALKAAWSALMTDSPDHFVPSALSERLSPNAA